MTHPAWQSMCAALTLSVALGFAQAADNGTPKDRLFARIYGSVAAATIGNSMGEPVEGWNWERIEKTHGLVDRLLPGDRLTKDSTKPQRFGSPWVYRAYHREPGWTEDGMERYKLLSSAIIRKGGRITVEDLAVEWVEKIDPAKFGYHLGPQDQIIYNLLKAGVPPWEVGRYAAWPAFMGTSKMIQPVGIVNACRPDVAARDALDLARIKDAQGRPDNYAVEVAAGIAAATAEALRPGATVDSVVQAALAQLPDVAGVADRRNGGRAEVAMGIQWAKQAKHWKDLRPLYEQRYQWRAASLATEILSGGLACFYMAKGDPREGIICAVNLGRDTDCKAYIAGGLGGALRGIEALPGDWVETVEKAVLTDPYTVDKRTARQLSEGLYRAAVNEMRKTEAATSEIKALLAQ